MSNDFSMGLVSMKGLLLLLLLLLLLRQRVPTCLVHKRRRMVKPRYQSTISTLQYRLQP
jgi:hypothetical protein